MTRIDDIHVLVAGVWPRICLVLEIKPDAKTVHVLPQPPNWMAESTISLGCLEIASETSRLSCKSCHVFAKHIEGLISVSVDA